ncbi:MAG: TIGR00366 family protein [Myxococcota bacterium]
MLRRLGHRFAAVFKRITPDPFLLAVLLTVSVFLLAFLIEGADPISIIRAWQGDTGFWSLLQFSMQMVLILVTGHALASAPAIRSGLRAAASIPRTGAQAAAMVSAVAIATALLNWGLGLIVGSLLAREVGKSCVERGVRAHYPLVAAAGYSGLMAWHGGFSGSAPLMMTVEENVTRFLGADAGVDPLPFTATVLSVENLIVSGGLLVFVPLLCASLAPRERDEVEGPPPSVLKDSYDRRLPEPETTVERIQASPFVTALVVLPLVCACAVWLYDNGIGKLDPNAINLLFLTLGLIAHGRLPSYLRAVQDAVAGTSGIIVQFPFYAGIMGVMRGTGLLSTFAGAITGIATPQTFAALTCVSAGLINLFVPSGGGQWAVQGPIAVQASETLGVPLQNAVMAVAYGDQLTNMLQPFWALPLLGITQVKARDILGYSTVLMIFGFIWCMTWLTVWSL